MILALLILDHTDNYEFFCYKYKISNNIKDKFKNISKNIKNLKSRKFYQEENLKKLIYFTDKNFAKDILFFSKCANEKIIGKDFKKLLDYINACKTPTFPLSGNDLKKQGYTSGIELGKKLKFLEQEWIANNFVLDKKLVKKTMNKTD